MQPTMRDLLEAGVHFGHQVRKWNPKMRPYIYTARDGVHVVDLAKTAEKLTEAMEFAKKLGQEGKTLIFVGTKKQAAAIIEEEAKRCGALWINHRWVGGLLTNWDQVHKNVKKLTDLKTKLASDFFADRTKKEVLLMQRAVDRLRLFYGGIEQLTSLPDALFIVDCRKEENAVSEAGKMGVAIIAICDTNCDPERLDFPIPGNDDAVKSIRLITKAIADAYLEGRQLAEKGVVDTAKQPQETFKTEEIAPKKKTRQKVEKQTKSATNQDIASDGIKKKPTTPMQSTKKKTVPKKR